MLWGDGIGIVAECRRRLPVIFVFALMARRRMQGHQCAEFVAKGFHVKLLKRVRQQGSRPDG